MASSNKINIFSQNKYNFFNKLNSEMNIAELLYHEMNF